LCPHLTVGLSILCCWHLLVSLEPTRCMCFHWKAGNWSPFSVWLAPCVYLAMLGCCMNWGWLSAASDVSTFFADYTAPLEYSRFSRRFSRRQSHVLLYYTFRAFVRHLCDASLDSYSSHHSAVTLSLSFCLFICNVRTSAQWGLLLQQAGSYGAPYVACCLLLLFVTVPSFVEFNSLHMFPRLVIKLIILADPAHLSSAPLRCAWKCWHVAKYIIFCPPPSSLSTWLPSDSPSLNVFSPGLFCTFWTTWTSAFGFAALFKRESTPAPGSQLPSSDMSLQNLLPSTPAPGFQLPTSDMSLQSLSPHRHLHRGPNSPPLTCHCRTSPHRHLRRGSNSPPLTCHCSTSTKITLEIPTPH